MEISNIFISLIRKPEKKDSSGALIGGVGIKMDVARIWWCVFLGTEQRVQRPEAGFCENADKILRA